jgi:hypothetical protein
MDTGNWITLLGAVGSAGITYGVLSNKVGNLQTELRELKAEWNRSRERTGERLEAIGKDITKLAERSRHRPITRQGVPITTEGK